MAGPGPGDPDEHYDFLFKLVLVGDASVGKTCVVQRFKTGTFSERQGSTIGVDFTMKTLEIQAADLGHSWPGTVPHHYPELLPQCQWGHPCLRHHQEEHLPISAPLD
ncbi:ras-related protein Rab-43 isoform X2 [Octodon degus]|uniref:Ras-related protein Rab-43 isoform X2 n=1 Tax=Octodon degus TaxID=10160 RepID=A0A6P6DNU4_OCTDE|nr:ras-related protein Rab-43 isoform X2 [Octodon degus]